MKLNGTEPMKHFYIAAVYQKGGKFYAVLLTVAESTNLAHTLKDCHAANIFPTKKRAVEVVTDWNESFKAHGSFLY